MSETEPQSKHTPGPWRVQIDAGYVTITQDGWDTVIAEVSRKPDGEHIVDCVNGCKGLDPKALVAALEYIRESIPPQKAPGMVAFGGFLAGLRERATAALAKVKRAPGRDAQGAKKAR